MRIALDALGSDRAPAIEVEGAIRALQSHEQDINLVIVGDRDRVEGVARDAHAPLPGARGRAVVVPAQGGGSAVELLRNAPVLAVPFNGAPEHSNWMTEQRACLQAIAVEELHAQRQRLQAYTVQARFALAAIYDLSSTVGEVAK